MAQMNFGILNTDLPAQIGAMPANALAMRRQRIQQDEDRAFAREGQQMQNALARMQVQKTQADTDEEAAYKAALGGVQGNDYAGAMPKLLQASPTRALALQKQLTEQHKALIEGRSKMTDLQGKKLDMYRSQLTEIQTPEQMANWYVAQRQDPDLQGFAWPTTLQETLSQLQQASQNPRDFEQWKLKTALGMKAYMEMNKPELKSINLGGSERIVDMNPYSNPSAAGQTFQRTVSPDAQLSAETARRGQNMTDERARAALEQSAQQHSEKMGMERQKLGAEGMKLTEIQGKSQLFGSRAAEADKILAGLEGQVSPTALAVKRGLENTWGVGGALGAVANSVMPENAQRVEQAQRDFVNAVLRLESGAAISPSEFASAQKQYFPQPGDSQAVIEQKQRNRQTAIAGLRTMAGPASGKVQPRVDEQQPGQGGAEFDSMPNPAQYAGKVIRDQQTGIRYRSNGSQWMKE